jgi:endonuclease/exonuclease/phosphatase family metal-dependent hydrolase
MFELVRHRLAAASLLVAVIAACDSPADTGLDPRFAVETGWERSAFDVYSQNLYLGGDTGPLFNADLSDPVALVQAVNTFWDQVQASDVQGRMAEIAEEIAIRNPEVVGLQEVLQFVTIQITPQGPQPTGVTDLLGSLMAEIQARGLPYVPAVVQPTTSATLPLAIDFGTGQVTRALSFTDRAVVLVRTDVDVTDQASAVYAAAVPLAGILIQRGWARVTVDHAGVPHHFVTTHLEVQAAQPIHDLQAAELLATVGSLDGITIVAGDLNSDATAEPGDPSWTPTYDSFIAAGFADAWELAPHSRRDPGFTCCQDPSLRNGTSELDERIDFVLVRSSEEPIPGEDNRRGHFRADVVGDRPADRTDGGLWPSDHAGVVGSVRMPD